MLPLFLYFFLVVAAFNLADRDFFFSQDFTDTLNDLKPLRVLLLLSKPIHVPDCTVQSLLKALLLLFLKNSLNLLLCDLY